MLACASAAAQQVLQTEDVAATATTSSAAADTSASAPMAVSALTAPKPHGKSAAAISLVGSSNWASLNPSQRTVLSPLASDWDALETTSQRKWLEVAARFHTLSPEQQARIKERMSDWARMSPNERLQARAGFQASQQGRSADLQAKWEAYQALPAEQRQQLAEKGKHKQAAAPTKPASAPSTNAKNNLVPAPQRRVIVAISPSVLQAKPGATTVLITQGAERPTHQWAGQTKVLVDPALVDPQTLLPKRSPLPTSLQ